LQVTGGTGGFTGNTLHSAPITKEAIGVVADEIIARLIEDGSSVRLSNGKTNCICETLSKRASCDFNTFGIMTFRMTRCDATDLL
jgi:hypothetical protein